jgi:cellulose biosynthesis protein BcsQ
LIEEELPGVPVLAFHSYKGGVGRTLALLAFVKAWSSLKNVDNPKKLLIVDADIEAPGISWLTVGQAEAAFSLLDLLEVTQEKDHIDEVVALAYDKISELTIKVETEKALVEHIVLPTYRYTE